LRLHFVIMKCLGAREGPLLRTRRSGKAETEMKKSVLCSYIVAAVLMAGPATHAEDLWGCEVMLCLAAPGGWSGIPACHPPMERLRQHLGRKRPFPPCPQASAPSTSPPPALPLVVRP
jgi:hypothetical protein